MNRRETLLTGMVATLMGGPALARQSAFEVYKTPESYCCTTWVQRLEERGHAAISMDLDPSTLHNLQKGTGEAAPSCHIAFVGPYVFLGHVPMTHIERFLKEQPEAVGLSAPGLAPGSRPQLGQTRLILHSGDTQLYPQRS